MSLCNKQHSSNIWGLIYQNVKQLWGWIEKKAVLIKKSCSPLLYLLNKITWKKPTDIVLEPNTIEKLFFCEALFLA